MCVRHVSFNCYKRMEFQTLEADFQIAYVDLNNLAGLLFFLCCNFDCALGLSDGPFSFHQPDSLGAYLNSGSLIPHPVAWATPPFFQCGSILRKGEGRKRRTNRKELAVA